MICPSCRAEVSREAKFCPGCGAPLATEVEKPSGKPSSAGNRPSFLGKIFRPLANLFRTHLKLVIISLAVLALAGGGVLVGLKLGSGVGEADSESTRAAVSVTEDTEVSLAGAKLSFPKDSVAAAGEVEIKTVATKSAPQPGSDASFVGQIYDVSLTAELRTDRAAYISLTYDPADFPAEANEDNLYLAHYKSGEWRPVAGAFVDKENKVVTAPLSDFSLLALLIDPVGSLLRSDVIEPVSRFADLPYGIKVDLDGIYSQSSIRSGLYWRVSALSRAASQAILGANFINNISGGILTVVEGGADAVAGWVTETLILEVGRDFLAATAGEEAADFTVELYGSGGLGLELAREGFEGIRDSAMLKAKVTAWVLDKEMSYINDNLDEAYSRIATLNLWSSVTTNEPLKIYVIAVEGEDLETGMFDIGLKFYYYNDSRGQWENYADDFVSLKLSEVALLGVGVEEEESGSTEEVAEPAEPACSSVDLSGIETRRVDKSNNQCSSWGVSASATKAELGCNEMGAEFRIHGIKEVSTGGADTVRIRADLTLSEPARLFPGGGVHYDNYVDLIVYGSLPDTLNSCGSSVGDDAWGTTCYALNQEDAVASGRSSTVLAHCGVPKNSTSATCDFEVSTGGREKLYLVMVVKDAWAYAQVGGAFSNLQVCR